MGDLNLDRLKQNTREGKILTDLEEVHGFECLVDKPTRITNHSSTLLDVILTNKPELFHKHGIFEPGLSDHCLVYGEMKLKAVKYRHKIIQFRSYKNVDMEALKRDLETTP